MLSMESVLRYSVNGRRGELKESEKFMMITSHVLFVSV